MILLFAYVKTENDLIPYVCISVVASSGASIVNAVSRRKYCKIKIILNKKVIDRLWPILILFGNTVATTIYVNSDMTMVGAFSGAYSAGLYSVSTKLYFIIKNLLSAIIIVSIPRLSAYLGKHDQIGYKDTAEKILDALIIFVTPVVVGLLAIAKNIILIIAGEEYIEATASLQILSIALLFCLFGWFYTSCVLIPNKKDKNVLTATVISAILNVGLNVVLIPLWKQNAAAITTVLAEFTSMLICYHYGKKCFKYKIKHKEIIAVLSGNIIIYLICKTILFFIQNVLLSTIISVCISVIAYMIIMILTHNSAIKYLIDNFNIRRKKSR